MSVLSTGALLFAACWLGCALDRSGLSSGGNQPGGSGGNVTNPLGTGGIATTGSGGSTVHFGTGGVGTGGYASGGGSGLQSAPGTGGTAGVIASGGSGEAGQGTGGRNIGSGGEGGGPVPPGKGGGMGPPGNPGGGPGPRAGGHGGTVTGAAGGWNWGSGSSSGSGGWTWGTGASSGTQPMCDPSIRDKDTCELGTADCRKTCGVSGLGTKQCTCTNRQWNCGDCAYPPGDYSCYQLPASGMVSPCPANTVNGMTSCFGDCKLCANYTDTTGMPKMGYCACNQDPGDTQRLYHCASISEWPPQ